MFTEEMKEEYTILVPMMLPIHFSMLKAIFQREGYHMEVNQLVNPMIYFRVDMIGTARQDNDGQKSIL